MTVFTSAAPQADLIRLIICCMASSRDIHGSLRTILNQSVHVFVNFEYESLSRIMMRLLRLCLATTSLISPSSPRSHPRRLHYPLALQTTQRMNFPSRPYAPHRACVPSLCRERCARTTGPPNKRV